MPTNMDSIQNKNATEPVFEFTLPKSELDASMSLDEKGKIMIPVQVVSESDSSFTFRKIGKCEVPEEFKDEPLDEMRKRIGVVEEEENPHKEEK